MNHPGHLYEGCEWKNPSNGRCYKAYIIQDLLGDWLLITLRGGQQHRKATQKNYLCTSYEEALQRMKKIKQIRKWHGYFLKE